MLQVAAAAEQVTVRQAAVDTDKLEQLAAVHTVGTAAGEAAADLEAEARVAAERQEAAAAAVQAVQGCCWRR